WRYHEPVEAPRLKSAGDNPPKGALIHYYLKRTPAQPVKLEVFDAKGALVRTLSSKLEDEDELPPDDPESREEKPKKPPLTAKVGVNRGLWDLRYDGGKTIPKGKNDGGNLRIGPLVVPGTYTLKLTADGQTFNGKVEVRQDPRVTIPLAELEEQLK